MLFPRVLLVARKRIFTQSCSVIKYSFLMGFLFRVVFVGGCKLGDVYGDRIRRRVTEKYSEATSEKIERFIFKYLVTISWMNPVLIHQGMQSWYPADMVYFTPAWILGWILSFYIKRRYAAWWETYAYVLATAFTEVLRSAQLLCSVQYRIIPGLSRGGIAYHQLELTELVRPDIYLFPQLGILDLLPALMLNLAWRSLLDGYTVALEIC